MNEFEKVSEFGRLNKVKDDYEEDDEEDDEEELKPEPVISVDEYKPKKRGYGKLKFVIFLLILVLGFAVGLALGFYLGMVSIVNVMGDLSENMTVEINFDEDVAMNYAVKFFQEEYGDLIDAVLLNQNINLDGMTDDEKIAIIVEGLDIDELEQYVEIDDDTRALLEEAKKHPEMRDIGQTMQNFTVPKGGIAQ